MRLNPWARLLLHEISNANDVAGGRQRQPCERTTKDNYMPSEVGENYSHRVRSIPQTRSAIVRFSFLLPNVEMNRPNEGATPAPQEA